MLFSSVDLAFSLLFVMETMFFTYRGKHEKQKKMELEKHEKATKKEARKENEKRSKKEELLGGAMHLALLKRNRARPTYARSYYIILI